MSKPVRLPMSLDDWVQEAYATEAKKGFNENDDPVFQFLENWDADDDIRQAYLRTAMLARIGLIHTEVTEMMQIIKRHGVPYDDEKLKAEFGEEAADVFIRLGGVIRRLGINFESSVSKKNEKNKNRPFKYNTPDEVIKND